MLVGLAAMGLWRPASAQSLEPRSYANVPVAMNFVLGGYGYSTGDLILDASVPLEDASVDTHLLVAGYARGLDVFGHSGLFSVVGSYASTSGDALYRGSRVSGENAGLADPAARVGVNLFGAPAMKRSAFGGWKQNLIVGVSLLIQPPLGDYESRILSIGTNRWTFRPEVGVSKVVGAWQLELAVSTSWFTDNDDPPQGDRKSQDPIHAARVHVIRNLRHGRWVSFDATHYEGGDVMIDGVRSSGLQRNGRYGVTFSSPVGNAGDSVKVYASTGAYARVGSDFTLVGVAWQRGWGGD
jgi:hypothetical protein